MSPGRIGAQIDLFGAILTMSRQTEADAQSGSASFRRAAGDRGGGVAGLSKQVESVLDLFGGHGRVVIKPFGKSGSFILGADPGAVIPRSPVRSVRPRRNKASCAEDAGDPPAHG